MAPPVEVLEGRQLLSTFTVTRTADDANPGTLRWAIGQVNADTTDTRGQHDQIHFAIPATDPGHSTTTGVWTIAPATALPVITRPVIIDGYTQAGASANTSALADNAVIKVELSGVRASIPSGLSFGPGSGALMADGTFGPSAPGWLTADSSGVRGLAIHSFAADVAVDAAFDTLVDGCFLGVDASGRAQASGDPRSDVGIDITAEILGATRVGGPSPDDRNLIANCAVGVRVSGGSQILGNLIGTDRSGLLALPNTDGVSAVGTSIGPGNVISGNLDAGIVIVGGAPGVMGNYIGTDVTGEAPLGNGVAGIRVDGGFLPDIGGTTPAERNVISGNGALGQGRLRGGIVLTGDGTSTRVVGNSIGTDASATRDLGNSGSGIVVGSGNSDSFTANAIAFNTGLGIDLVGGTENAFGVTANSPGGPHTGPNDLQNYPVLTSAAASATSTAIGGTLNSIPGSTFTIQLYSNPTADPSGHGQGLDYLGSTTAVTDASGDAVFRFNAPGDLVGRFLTATATYASSATPTMLPGDTSEFSADIQATASSQTADLSATATSTPSPHISGVEVTDHLTITNHGPDEAQGLVATIQIAQFETIVSLTSSDPDVTIPTLPANSEFGLTLPFQVPALASGQSVTFALVLDGVGSETSATVAVASLTPDPDPTNNAASASSPSLNPTTTSLSVSPASATFGQTVTFTASPSNGFSLTGPAPGGTMTFSVDGVPTATVPLTIVMRVEEVFSFADFSTSLAVGSHRITAHYSGDANNLPSDAPPVTLVVSPTIATTTVFNPPPVPSKAGQPVAFTVTVLSGQLINQPFGTVTFSIDGLPAATVNLRSIVAEEPNVALFETSSLAAGTHVITAHYNGIPGFYAPSEVSVTQVVDRSSTVTALAASPSPATFGQPVTFTAVVAPAPLADGPTGAVTFFIDGVGFTVPLVPSADGLTGTASYTPPVLGVGTHTVAAVYNGDPSFAPSASGAIAETVNPAVPVGPAPRLVEVLRFGYHAMPTALAVVFDTALDAASALDLANYQLLGPHRLPIPLVAAALGADGKTVVLQPRGRLNVHWTYTLTVVGTPPVGIRNAAGVYAGVNQVELITLRNLVLAHKLPVAAHPTARPKPSAHAVDAVLASEHLAHAQAIAARRHRR